MAEMKQRLIKFRIAISSPHWDEDPGSTKISEPLTLGEIIDHQQIDFTDGGYIDWDDIDWEQDTVHYLQYTGLDDKSGTEIYDGDVIDTFNALKLERGLPHDVRGVVRYREEAGYFFLESDEKFYSLMSRLEAPEVIGNIHQSGDLLNA